MKKSFSLFAIIMVVTLSWGVYKFCEAILADANGLMDDALNGEEVNVEDSLIYKLGENYSDR